MSGYKINSKKSVAVLYTSDKWTDKEIRETTPFIIVMNNIKCLGVALTKQVWQKLQILEEKNQRRYQKIERAFMLVDR